MWHPPNPVRTWANTCEVWFVMAEAQAVIAMRLMGMAGVWSVAPSESSRMVSEKVHAVTKGITDGMLALSHGAHPDQIAAVAIKPIRQKTHANAKRLGKRGPKR
jgi:hypothetical protein